MGVSLRYINILKANNQTNSTEMLGTYDERNLTNYPAVLSCRLDYSHLASIYFPVQDFN